MTSSTDHPIVWLAHAGQRLGLVPSLGGGVAAWVRDAADGGPPLDLWRPWDGVTPDLYRLASFAMVPWSNRISGGGFAHDG
ncbi:MAG: aldose 1-epimerase, partial [Variovorax sp.]